MEPNKILSADILDIIFDGKNKEYGAYYLRKNYNKTLTRALIFTAAVMLLAFLGSVFANYINKNKKAQNFDVVETQMAEIKKDEPPPPPPPPPPPVRPTIKFVEMIAKKDEEVPEDKQETKQEEIKETQVSNVTNEGDKNAKAIVEEPKVHGDGPAVTVAPEPEAPKETEIFDRAEVMPGYPGGQTELMKYLSKNINYPSIAKENGLEGKVIVKFFVDTDGSVKDPVVLKDGVGGGSAEEAVRVIKKMPKWTPGTQRGKPVRVYYTLPVTFKLSN